VSHPVRIGTRGSALALKQASRVQQALTQQFPQTQFEQVIIQTSGDKDLTSPLSEIGGKGVFIKELEDALLTHEIELAVHSLKDITSTMPESLSLAAFLQAESVSDCLIMRECHSLNALPKGAKIGTGSLRRTALLHRLRPDLRVVSIRGNVQTRLDKMTQEGLDGVILSEAGLIRLDIQPNNMVCFDPRQFLPAPGQGVITIQIRESDKDARDMCEAINHQEQAYKCRAELAFLKQVGFDCQSPLGLFTELKGKEIKIKGFLANNKMNLFYEEETSGLVSKSITLGTEMGNRFKAWLNKQDN